MGTSHSNTYRVKDPKTPYEFAKTDKAVYSMEEVSPELMYQIRPQLDADARHIEELLKKYDAVHIYEKDILRVSYKTLDKPIEWCILNRDTRVKFLAKNIKIPFVVSSRGCAVGFVTTFMRINNLPSNTVNL